MHSTRFERRSRSPAFHHTRLVLVASLAAVLLVTGRMGAQSLRVPTARLIAAPTLRLPGSRPTQFASADSNSPAIWTLENGVPLLHLVTSFDGYASISSGTALASLPAPTPVAWDHAPPHGVWFESILADDDGTWYGYYHNEVPPPCDGVSSNVVPRIGAAVSHDAGQSWRNLGIVLDGPPGAFECQTRNNYFVGGVGDFTVMLDAMSQDVYFFYSTYPPDVAYQGVAAARLAWADRDVPVGRVMVWVNGAWIPASEVIPQPEEPPFELTAARSMATAIDDAPDDQGTGPTPGEPSSPEVPGSPEEPGSPDEPASPDLTVSWQFPAGTPIFPTSDSWHDGTRADAFWGPSVHWNSHLGQYVMLLNRTKDVDWTPDGIYVSFSPSLSDPTKWSPPQRILDEGSWYPQVMGSEPGEGTDKLAGQVARFFMAGLSRHYIVFERQ